jgi:hypothetical protein
MRKAEFSHRRNTDWETRPKNGDGMTKKSFFTKITVEIFSGGCLTSVREAEFQSLQVYPGPTCLHSSRPGKGVFMLFRLIGKRLFPRAHPWEQKRKVRTMFFVLLVALVAAGGMGMMIYKHGR